MDKVNIKLIRKQKREEQKKEATLRKKAQKIRCQELLGWQRHNRTSKMKMAVLHVYSQNVQSMVEDELSRNDMCMTNRSHSFDSDKKRHRLIRRVIEKRVAQRAHHSGKNWDNTSRFMNRNVQIYTNRCWRSICVA